MAPKRRRSMLIANPTPAPPQTANQNQLTPGIGHDCTGGV